MIHNEIFERLCPAPVPGKLYRLKDFEMAFFHGELKEPRIKRYKESTYLMLLAVKTNAGVATYWHEYVLLDPDGVRVQLWLDPYGQSFHNIFYMLHE